MLDDYALRTLTMVRVVCGALVGGVVAFATAVVFLTRSGFFGSAPELSRLLLPLAGIFTVASVLAAPFIESMMRKIDGDSTRAAALARFNGAVIVGFALREGAALFALAVALVTGNVMWGLGLAGLACLGMALAWPTEDALRRHMRGVG